MWKYCAEIFFCASGIEEFGRVFLSAIDLKIRCRKLFFRATNVDMCEKQQFYCKKCVDIG